MYPKTIFALTLSAILLAMVACGTNDTKISDTLTVSIEPQRKILEEIVGDDYRVVSVLAKGANPETYDPTMSQRMDLSKSAAYFTTGYMPFEQKLAMAVEGEIPVVNTSYGISAITGTHSHGDSDHSVPDPHVWTSVRNARTMADNMLSAMVKINPTHADIYRERHHRLTTRLDSLDNALGCRIADSRAHAFVVWHPSLSYYARDYGLHQIGVGQESKEQSIGNLTAIIDEAKADSVRVFFFQKEFDSRQAESINNEIGSRLITIDPLAYDWEQELTKITDELTR